MKLRAIPAQEMKDTPQFSNAGLYAKPVFLNYLREHRISLPVCYITTAEGRTLGHAVLSKTDLEWKFLAGEKKLFAMKTSGITLRNAFRDLSQIMFEQISQCDILTHHSIDAMLLISIPTDYLNDSRRFLLNHSPGLSRYTPRVSSPHYYLDVEGRFDEFLSRLSRNSRQTLKKKVKRFSKRCKNDVSVRTYVNEGEMQDFFNHALSISRRTYQHKLLGAGLDTSSEFQAYLGFLARNDYVRAYILFDGDHPVAYLYSTLIDGRMETHKTGYDPAYAKMSPGTVLYYHVMERVFDEQQVDIVDFSTGSGPLKKLFATGCTECIDVYYIRKSFKPLATVILHFLFHECMNMLRTVMEKAGIKERVKRFFRNQ